MRIRVSDVRGLYEAGLTAEQILDEMADLEMADLKAALIDAANVEWLFQCRLTVWLLLL